MFLIVLSAILVQAGSGAEARDLVPLRVCAAAVVLSLFHWTLGRLPAARAPRRTCRSLGDLALVCVLVYSSAAPSSVFTFLYLVVIGAAAFLLYRTGAVVIASVAALLHGLDGRADGLRGAAPAGAGRCPRWDTERIGYNLAITVVGFYGVAFMVSYLSEKLRVAREELERAPEGALAASRPSTPTSSPRCRRASSRRTAANA